MFKVLFDFLTSFTGLIFLLPVFLLTALMSIIFQGFPVFFLHKRLGKDGTIFTMIKFRTMINGPSLSAEDDITRLTRWGRFLRKTSIDELPVLINVIKGDMSLVGPRPLPVKYLSRFNSFQKKRMDVKPGITGLAQINGRNQLSWEDRFTYDVEYTRGKSFFLDLGIIFRTLYLVIFRKNIDSKSQEIMPEFMGTSRDMIDDK